MENLDADEVLVSKVDLDRLIKQNADLVKSLDTLSERFSGMGRLMMENNTKIAAKTDEIRADIDARCSPKRYTLIPTQSETIGKISEALSKVQMFTTVKSGESNRGTFSSIADMAEIKPFLEQHGLTITFHLGENEFGEYTLKQLVSHSSGEWLATKVLLHEEAALSPGEGLIKKVGAAEKSLRRYMLRSMLNFGESD